MAKRNKAPRGSIGPAGAAGPVGGGITGSQLVGAAGANAAPGGAVVLDRIENAGKDVSIAPFANATAYEQATGRKAPKGTSNVQAAVMPSTAGIITQATSSEPRGTSSTGSTKTVSTSGAKALADGDLAKEATEALTAQQNAQTSYQQGYAAGQATQTAAGQAGTSTTTTSQSGGGLLSNFRNLSGTAKLAVLVISGGAGWLLYRRQQAGKPLFPKLETSTNEGE